MLVKKLQLNDYRNYSQYSVEFDPKLNIIIGKNGVGKTNILESIIVVSNIKSFRTLDDKDLIKKEKEYLRILLESDTNKFKVVISNQGRSLFIDNNIIKTSSNFIGKLNAILFKPSDLELFNQSPSERRRLLDVEIGKVSNIYLNELNKYKYLLADKNKLLKELEIDENLLSVINESMIKPIETIITEREKFFEIINKYISDIYQNISNSKDVIQIVYKKCCDKENILENINKTKDKDKYYHYATFGPHHDDFEFKFNKIDINSIASQGQKRMAFIAFKFALIKYIESNINSTPIVLLDDILSELDQDNQERLLNQIPNNTQVIITNTDIKNLKINKEYKLIEIKEEKNV